MLNYDIYVTDLWDVDNSELKCYMEALKEECERIQKEMNDRNIVGFTRFETTCDICKKKRYDIRKEDGFYIMCGCGTFKGESNFRKQCKGKSEYEVPKV